MKRLILTLIAISFATSSLAKQGINTADSIKRLISTDLKSPKTIGSDNIDRVNKLAENYFESYPDSTLKYAELALDLSRRSGYTKGAAGGYNNIGMVNTFMGKYAIAAENFKLALRLNRSVGELAGMSDAYTGYARTRDFLGDYPGAIRYLDSAMYIRQKIGDQTRIAECYNYIGITYDNKGEFSKALDNYLRSLKIYLKQNNELASADNYCNIGIIMQHLELYPKALMYFDTALKIWQKYEDAQGISTIYLNNGEVFLVQKRYDEAFRTFKKALKIFEQMNDREGISLAYYDLGLCYYHLGKPDTALKYLHAALQAATKDRIRYNQAYAYLGLATVYNDKKDDKQALKYGYLARATAKSLGAANLQADAALQISLSYAIGGYHQKAYENQRTYVLLKDSVNRAEIMQQVAAYDLEQAFAKDELEYKRQNEAQALAYKQALREKRDTIIIYTIITALIASIAFVYYRGKLRQTRINRELIEKNHEIEAQKNSLDEHSNRLNELNLLKDRLIAVLAHDLRAPLSTLRGLFGLMADEDLTSEEFAEMAPKVFARLENTSDFLDTLLFWINSQVDGKSHNNSSFCLCTLVDKELLMLDSQIKQKDLKIDNKVGKGHTVLADPNSIRIVVHNFLTNAIKFSKPGNTIHLTAYIKEERLRTLEVRDEGVGMSPDQLSALFKTKVSSSPGTNSELGTGMGLLFCRDLVENYKGNIWAESELGKGTAMFFSLPIA